MCHGLRKGGRYFVIRAHYINKLTFISTSIVIPQDGSNSSVVNIHLFLNHVFFSSHKFFYKLAIQCLLQLLLLLLSRFSRVRLCGPHRWQPTRLPRPWDSPGKNTGLGCHFLLQCMQVKGESEVAQSCLTPSDPMDCSLPGSSVHGIYIILKPSS